MQTESEKKLAEIIAGYSLDIQKGEKVLINNVNPRTDFVNALVRAVYKRGGLPFVQLTDKRIERELLMNATEEQLNLRAEAEAAFMKEMDCYIGFTALENLSELKDVSPEKMQLYNRTVVQKVTMETRLPFTRWVVLRYPTGAYAQLADMSLEEFEEFFFKVCTLDYEKMDRAMEPLKELMEKTDIVEIKGPGTDLRFSIKGLPAVKCSGKRNIPDGEIYTAPVRDSVNGTITYNTPSLENGFVFENISFAFKNGRIIEASANNTQKLNAILDTDEGARFVGEFSFGLNPYILKPMKETLFDEKISGSIHFTPGNAYESCDNGNRSAVHWDLVLIQRPESGGGEIYFDGKLIRKDGRFVLPELDCLNPENLV